MSLEIEIPFNVFPDVDGQPLDDGYLYIGTNGLNPESNPISVYWDAALTIPAAQPIRTINGFPSNNGTPGNLYINAVDYSITVRNKNGSLVHSLLSITQSDGSEWSSSYTAIYVDADTFRIENTDVRSVFKVGRRVKLTGGADRYATISAVSFSTHTDVDVIWTTDENGVPSTLHASMGIAIAHILANNVYPDVVVEPLQYVRSLSDLQGINPVNTRRIYLNYHTTEGDGGGGVFRAVSGAAAATYTDDNGIIILPSGGDGSAAWIREYSGPIDVRWYGAVGDKTTLNTTAFQSVLDYITTSLGYGAEMYIPAGEWLSGPLTLAAGSGPVRIIGAGAYIGNPQTGTRVGSSSIIYFSGTAGQTLFETIGTSGVSLEDMTLVGRPTGAGNQAGILWHTKGGSGGFGSGVSQCDRVVFVDAATAVQFADNTADTNAADINFGWVYFESCTTGVDIKNDQGVNYVFDFISANACNSVIHGTRGGRVNVNHANLSNCGGAGATDWCFLFDALDDGTGKITLRDVSIEQNTQQVLKAVNHGHIEIVNFNESQGDQNVTMWDIRGPTVNFRGCRFITNDTTNPNFSVQYGGGGQQTGLIFEDCHFDVTSWAWADWFTYDVNDILKIKIDRCQYGNTSNLEVPYFNTVLEWGKVTTKAQTTSASAVVCAFDGTATTSVSKQPEIQDDTYWLIDFYFVGAQSDGSNVATFHRRATFKNVAGTLTQVGSTITVGTDENTPAWPAPTVSAVDSIDIVRGIVSGAAATTINWSCNMVGNRVY